ncbi:hypothetical protein FGB62_58g041 [Gracilaria domingensis]|nr:hypothetical protein FGB62_58g041 [Gracilaria domingensis]
MLDSARIASAQRGEAQVVPRRIWCAEARRRERAIMARVDGAGVDGAGVDGAGVDGAGVAARWAEALPMAECRAHAACATVVRVGHVARRAARCVEGGQAPMQAAHTRRHSPARPAPGRGAQHGAAVAADRRRAARRRSGRRTLAQRALHARHPAAARAAAAAVQ